MIECRHEVSRTSLRSSVGGVGYGDFDISDAVSFFCVCGNPRRAESSGTPRRGSVERDTHLFRRGYCLWSSGCRVWAPHIQVYESGEAGIIVRQPRDASDNLQAARLPLHLRLRAVSSVVERLVYTERVGGSKPSPPILSVTSDK